MVIAITEYSTSMLHDRDSLERLRYRLNNHRY